MVVFLYLTTCLFLSCNTNYKNDGGCDPESNRVAGIQRNLNHMADWRRSYIETQKYTLSAPMNTSNTPTFPENVGVWLRLAGMRAYWTHSSDDRSGTLLDVVRNTSITRKRFPNTLSCTVRPNSCSSNRRRTLWEVTVCTCTSLKCPGIGENILFSLTSDKIKDGIWEVWFEKHISEIFDLHLIPRTCALRRQSKHRHAWGPNRMSSVTTIFR